MRAEQDAESHRVDEGDRGQVDDDVLRPALDRVVQTLAQLGGDMEVDLAVERVDERVAARWPHFLDPELLGRAGPVRGFDPKARVGHVGESARLASAANVGGFVPHGSPEYAPVVTPYELEVHEPAAHGVTVVKVEGELDLTNAAEVGRRLEEAAGEGGLVLDLNGVGFLDSAALHMLFHVARQLGDPLRFGIVVEPTALVARTLDIVGLAAVATVRPTLDELVGEPTP